MRAGGPAVVLSIALMGACAHGTPQLTHHESGVEKPLEEFRGRVVVLNFWATWCRPCIHEIPVLLRLAEETRGRVQVIAVYYEYEATGRPAVERWLQHNPAGFTPHIAYGNDGLHAKFPHRAIPTTYILDESGTVVDHVTGALTLERARGLIQRALDSRARERIAAPLP